MRQAEEVSDVEIASKIKSKLNEIVEMQSDERQQQQTRSTPVFNYSDDDEDSDTAAQSSQKENRG